MAAAIQREHPDARVDLVEGGRGDFIVTCDGDRLWDKKGDQGRFPDEDEILARLDV